MMNVAFTEGTEVIVRYFRELYLIDLKLPNHQAVEQFNLRVLGRGQALPDCLPDCPGLAFSSSGSARPPPPAGMQTKVESV